MWSLLQLHFFSVMQLYCLEGAISAWVMRALYASFFVFYDCQVLRPREGREKGEDTDEVKERGIVEVLAKNYVVLPVGVLLSRVRDWESTRRGNTHGLSPVYPLCETTSCYWLAVHSHYPVPSPLFILFLLTSSYLSLSLAYSDDRVHRFVVFWMIFHKWYQISHHSVRVLISLPIHEKKRYEGEEEG